jgi:hypothetical protein
MDCKTARLLLDFHRPRAGELTPDEAAALEGHLASCAECDAAGRAQRRLEDHLGRAMRDVPLPPRLRQQVLARVRRQHHAARVRQFVWAARGLAAAAALLLAVALGWHFIGARPRLDVHGLYEADLLKHHSTSPENVQIWLQEHRHVNFTPPAAFDYSYLADYDAVEWQGKRVPKLVFFRSDPYARARVYVVSSDRFDLADLPSVGGPYEFDDSGERLQVWEPKDTPPGRSTIRYLIFYSGESLEPLLDKNQPPPM